MLSHTSRVRQTMSKLTHMGETPTHASSEPAARLLDASEERMCDFRKSFFHMSSTL